MKEEHEHKYTRDFREVTRMQEFLVCNCGLEVWAGKDVTFSFEQKSPNP